MVDQVATDTVVKTKSENLRTDLLTLQQIRCESCRKKTPHKILASHETVTKFSEVNESGEHALFEIAYDWKQIVRCEKCEAVSFRALDASTGFPVKNRDGVYVDLASETRYSPNKESRRQLDVKESTLVYD